MIKHPLRGGKDGAISVKQFTCNMLMGYCLDVKLLGEYLGGGVLFTVTFVVYLRPSLCCTQT